MQDQPARHRALGSVREVVQIIGVPALVTPCAPWGEQNAPGWTTLVDGLGAFAGVGVGASAGRWVAPPVPVLIAQAGWISIQPCAESST